MFFFVFGLPPAGRWELGAYPAFIDSHFVTPKLDFGQEKYDAMCHHSRYHKGKLDAMTYHDKKVFTIMRDPVENFESNFGFFRDYPYKQWLGDDYLKKFEIFVNNPSFYYDRSTFGFVLYFECYAPTYSFPITDATVVFVYRGTFELRTTKRTIWVWITTTKSQVT